MTAFGKIAEEGIDLLGRESPRASRIRAARVFYQWAAERLADAGPSLRPLPAKPAPKSAGSKGARSKYAAAKHSGSKSSKRQRP